MIDKSKILEILQQNNIPIAGSAIREAGDENQYYIFVTVSRDADNKQQPTNRKLQEVRQSLSQMGAKIDFLLTDYQFRDIEAGLRATLLHAFNNEIRNAYLSIDDKNVHVWLDQKQILEDSSLKVIQSRIEVYLNQFNLTLTSISNTVGDNLPSVFVCLKIIRLTSPVSIENLTQELITRNFSIPSKDWLTRRLDAMRRSGKIVRLDDGKYALSLESIRNLGAGKGRNSPDILRMLALARSS